MTITFPLVTIAYSFIPDVYMGSNETESDVFHTLIFHELAHASHFRIAGGDFWQALSAAEISNSGWGDNPNVYGAGRIALVEGWAEAVSFLFTDERYATAHSQNARWVNKLENTRNVHDGYIPVGVHYDLIDSAIDQDPSTDLRAGGSYLILDSISDITLSQLYSLLFSSTDDVDDYKSLIQQFLIDGTTNTQQELLDLFDRYEY